MNVKLHQVISDITGKTGMTILEAIVGGERDPRKLAQFRDPRTKADEETIALSLERHWQEEHIFELTQALELHRVYQAKIAECDREIETQMARFDGRSGGAAPAEQPRRNRIQGNAPRFDVRGHLYRMTGVDLTRINGVDAYTALKVISEVGTESSLSRHHQRTTTPSADPGSPTRPPPPSPRSPAASLLARPPGQSSSRSPASTPVTRAGWSSDPATTAWWATPPVAARGWPARGVPATPRARPASGSKPVPTAASR